MLRTRAPIVMLVALATCKVEDPLHCREHPEDTGCPTASQRCDSNNDCASQVGTPVCDLAQNACVQCTPTDHALCAGPTPRCNVHTCVACVDDNDCGRTGVCMLSGDCADTARIIHAVSAGGSDQATCGAMGNACNLDRALLVVSGNRNVIKLDDVGPYTTTTTNSFTVSIDVTIDARNAVLHNTNNDNPVLKINSNRTAAILGGRIEGGHGSGGSGLLCDINAKLTVDGSAIASNDESGIDGSNCILTVSNTKLNDNSRKVTGFFPAISASGGSITLSRSLFLANKGGGLYVGNNTRFVVVGNGFHNNGNAMSTVGGVFILISQDAGNRLDFNTISANNSQTGTGAGIQCSGTFIARNNIVWNNFIGSQVGGGCSHAYSDIGPVPGAFNDAGHNIAMNPLLASEVTDAHLQEQSPVRRQADPASDLTGIAAKDIDGDKRVVPADLGADQVP